jgi:hypothetical protein
MDVGAADTGPPYPDENVIYAESRDIDVLHPKAKFRFAFNKSLHNPRRTGHIHLKSFRVVERYKLIRLLIEPVTGYGDAVGATIGHRMHAWAPLPA